ncbi:peptide-methionine (S)-S-oxide reductase [Sphingomonas jejuensis]|uniref:Peptide methionine sulfoxide reductase MsrA n=1 Tax=Sphingomonas jejuensis TaxID=904715 RepID=A0ABX0XNS6_9SPHN|nr:peptide-methionine (S)-S-oxide reductase [Sphingomonas jejuensis]
MIGRLALLAGAATLAAVLAPAGNAAPVAVPLQQQDVRGVSGPQTAVFAGGCFWGIEGVFQHVRGVREVVSGYAGGAAADANYAAVSSERTGHAEAVRIVYDPTVVSYGDLLRIFFSVAHDPTQLNRQEPDEGPSYRSAIFPQSPAQAAVARRYIAQLNAAGVYPRPVVTRLESGRFYPAEASHQNFLNRNPDHGYIRRWDLPKLAALRQTFPRSWQAQPAR